MKFTNTKSFRKFQSWAMNGALKTVEGAMRVLPRGVTRFLVDGAFAIGCLFTRTLNKICIKNLRQVYGDAKTEKEYEQVARDYIKSVGHSMMDLMYYVEHPEEFSKTVRLEGEEHLKSALASGRGVIAVSAHLSNFPLMFVSLVQRGYKVNVIIRRMRDETFSKFMYNMCAKWGIHMIQTLPPKQFFRESLGALKRNELLFILLDEVVAKEDGVEVDFFNRKVMRAPGPMLFYGRTGAPIVPIFVAQEDKGRYTIFVEPSFPVRPGEGPDTVVENIGGLTAIIQKFVEKYPLQWGGWLNKRWSAQALPVVQTAAVSVPQTLWGLQFFGWGLIITSMVHLNKLIFDYDSYMEMYAYIGWLEYVRYGFSCCQRFWGIALGIGLLCSQKWARSLGILFGIFVMLTVFWKHPYGAFHLHAMMLDEKYGEYIQRWIPGLTFERLTVPSMIVHWTLDILFWSVFIYYVNRPKVKGYFGVK